MTAMLSLLVCDEIGVPEEERYPIVLYALHHDMSEIITGDISTVAKDIIRQRFGPDAFNDTDGVFPICEELRQRAGPTGRAVVKIADLIDALSFLNIEGIGNHSGVVFERIEKRFDEYVDGLNGSNPNYEWRLAKTVLNDVLYGEDLVL